MSIRILIVILLVFISEVKAQNYPYTMQADISMLVGKEVLPVPGVQVFNGVRIDKKGLEAGITVGADVYRQFVIMPVSASVKWMPVPAGWVLPYANLSLGYGLAWLNRETEEKNYRGGSIFNPSIGVRIKTKTKVTLNFAAGYKQQKAAVVERAFDDLGRTVSIATEKYKLGRIALTFGVGF